VGLRWTRCQESGEEYTDEELHALYAPNINLLRPNDIYICRTTALTSRRYILNIYSKNIHTEYFKHSA